MVARPLRIIPSILAAYIMFPYLDSGLDALLKHSHIGLFSPLARFSIPTPFRGVNTMTREGIECLSAKFHTGGQVATCLGYVALFPPMLRPTLVKNDLLHLEAFCLAEFEISTLYF
jgi:hypothetical protein